MRSGAKGDPQHNCSATQEPPRVLWNPNGGSIFPLSSGAPCCLPLAVDAPAHPIGLSIGLTSWIAMHFSSLALLPMGARTHLCFTPIPRILTPRGPKAAELLGVEG